MITTLERFKAVIVRLCWASWLTHPRLRCPLGGAVAAADRELAESVVASSCRLMRPARLRLLAGLMADPGGTITLAADVGADPTRVSELLSSTEGQRAFFPETTTS